MKLTEIEAVAEVLEDSDDGGIGDLAIKESRKGTTIRRTRPNIKGQVTNDIGAAIKSEVEAKELSSWTQFHQDVDVTSFSNKQVDDTASLKIDSL